MSNSAMGQAAELSVSDFSPGRWVLDPAHTSVTFRHTGFWGLFTIKGRFREVSGEGRLLQDGSLNGTLVVDAASVDTKVAKRDEHLRGVDFFDVANHPSFAFAVTGAALGDGPALQVAGELTVLGTPRACAVTAQVSDASPDAVTLSTELGIARKDFGMTWNKLGIMKEITTVTITARYRLVES
ncbi:YceI family protein [Streptomyces sp. NPDC090499]|uniref:YceI family protein n=1 Tax=Streptomyces sp. NPDC090499 TaxID=3365965 RepID=UPI0037FA0AAF